MKKYLGPILLVCILSLGSNAYGQAACPPSAFNGKLACILPALYGSTSGSGGFSAQGAFGNLNHVGHFDASIAQTLSPLNGDISRQINLLPTASPGSGFSLMFDPALKTFVTTTDSLGPIIGERADTIGRHRIAVGVSYQFFQFDKINGSHLANLPNVLIHADDIIDNQPPNVICSASLTGNPDQSLASYSDNPPPGQPHNQNNLLGDCSYVRDRIATVNRIDLKVHQITTNVTFGLTRNIEVSVVIPYDMVRFGVSSSATIVTGTWKATRHYFTSPGVCLDSNNSPPPPPFVAACFNHNFPDASLQGSSPSSSSASGIGDVTARLKATMWRGERAAFAAGVDVRFPTGEALNYLGSGAYGVKPFAIISYHSRIAPHGMIGFEANGSSVTSGNVATGEKGQIPNELVYDAGADAYATKWLTGALDIVGQRVFNAQTVAVTSQKFLAPCMTNDFTVNPSPSEPLSCDVTVTGSQPNPNFTNVPALPPVSAPTLTSTSATSYNITNASAGIKIAPLGRLVLTLNVLVRLDNGGLHAKPAPMGGLSYVF
jgi:hypothetical protein